MELGATWKARPACLLICLLWAGIYLPGLGSVPLKHEEPRRALPAVGMLATGDWLVPRIGATPYLRKPPLLNWLIAVSFRVAGGRSELAARVPSVLAMLALGLTVAIAARLWLGGTGALLAAIFVLTNLAVMETGRLAELEALYLSLTGIALTLWLTAWQARANVWRLWCVPAPFLALGMLTKGPAHLLFFYGVAGAVLIFSGEWKRLFHPAHGVALAVIVAPFLGWAIPCARAVEVTDHLQRPGGAWAFWWREISSRTTLPSDGHLSLGEWLLRIPQGFVNFLPWTVLLPLLWSPRVLRHFDGKEARDLALFRGARWGMVGTFVAMSLLPGGSARYVYPLVVVPSVLLAWVLSLPAGVGDPRLTPLWLPGVWRRVNIILCAVIVCAAVAMPFFVGRTPRLGIAVVESVVIAVLAVAIHRWRLGDEGRAGPLAMQSAASMVLITSIYALAAVPWLNRPRAGLPREVASSIRALMPAGKTLGVLDDGYQAFWYYLAPSTVYFRSSVDFRSLHNIDHFLLPAESLKTFTQGAASEEGSLRLLGCTSDADRHSFVLLTRSDSETPALSPAAAGQDQAVPFPPSGARARPAPPSF